MSNLLDHWHAATLSNRLRTQPTRVTIDGIPLVLYRPAEGPSVAALSDVCPHRRMSLSLGKVCGERLQCPYHGWTYAADGSGESPGTPKLRTRTESYETREAHGVIWVRRRGAESPFPTFIHATEGYKPMLQMEHDVGAPLELVLDNFNELEHTSTTHKTFGFPLDRLHEVELDIQQESDHVEIVYQGPSKPYPWLTRFFLRVDRDVRWYIKGLTYYSPVHTFGEYRWKSNKSGRWSPVRVMNVHVLTPLDDMHTRIFTLSYMRVEQGGFPWLLPIVKLFMRGQYQQEVNEDQRMLDGLAEKTTSLNGLKLSRFDRVLGINRKCIATLYRKAPSSHLNTSNPVEPEEASPSHSPSVS